MPVLEYLEPKAVFSYFERISAIPRGSRHTKAISDYCAAFARERGLDHRQDGANNVIIFAPASPGYETAEPIILQGHLDMVCEKAAGNPIHMEREGPRLVIDGGFVRADGTTLGGDDGIAVAMALAILDNPAIPRPRLEVVLTADEEIGMLGAAALDVSDLQGRRLLNLDSELEGVFTVSCAGGCVASCAIPVQWENVKRGSALRIRLDGLTGGHSGTEIHKGRANANVMMGRILKKLRADAAAGKAKGRWNTGLHLVRIDGGLKDNAIPVAAEMEIVAEDPGAVQKTAKELEAAFRREYRKTDPELSLSVTEAMAALAMEEESAKRVEAFLTEAPAGVQSMSAEIPGLVRTSLNLGVLQTQPEGVRAAFCVRSGAAAEKMELVGRLSDLSKRIGAALAVEGDYPPWEYRADSPLRRLCESVFKEQYGHAPKIEAIHAGLECGLFCGKLPGLDCISIGPDLLEIHTPRERMRIASVQRVWAFVLEVLRRAK